uniref:cytochrome P450 2C23-like n=1 Tax=Styela clava TaxID=7725 RepID=UPI001939F781|nr:cytochrome P450 2C23-like [Styela clava]
MRDYIDIFIEEMKKKNHDPTFHENLLFIGCDRKVSLSDRKNMPQTLAFYHELMRRCTLVKNSLTQALEDGVVVNGYRLLKHTTRGLELNLAMLATTLLLVFIASLFIYWYRRDSRLPPGPRGIPILGTIPFWGSNPAKKLTEWSKTYGGAYTIRSGTNDILIITDYEIMYDVHIRQASKMGARPRLGVFETANKGIGIIFATPKVSEIHRNFTLQALRRLGLGKNTMEDRIQQESTCLIEAIQSKSGKPFNPGRLFLYAAFNISCLNTMGERYPYDDKILEQMGSGLVDGLRENGLHIFLISMCKYLKYFVPFKTARKRYVHDFNDLLKFFTEKVTEHENTYDETKCEIILTFSWKK